MQTALVIKAHVNDDGTIVLDEPAPLRPGPVLLTVLPVGREELASAPYTDEEYAELWRRIDAIAALPGPPPPEDGLTAKDAETILYGPHNSTNDVR